MIKLRITILLIRCPELRARGTLYPEAATVLRRLRLHGPRGRLEGQGDQESDIERGCGLHHRWQGRPHRGCLSRNYQNGNE